MAGLAVNSTGQIVAVDSVSPTVFVIAESGDLLRWFDCSDYMREPSDIAISGNKINTLESEQSCLSTLFQARNFSSATSKVTALSCSTRMVSSCAASAARTTPTFLMESTYQMLEMCWSVTLMEIASMLLFSLVRALCSPSLSVLMSR